MFRRTQDSLELQNRLYGISFVIEARISMSQIIAITFVMESSQKEINVYHQTIKCPPNHYKLSSYYKIQISCINDTSIDYVYVHFIHHINIKRP